MKTNSIALCLTLFSWGSPPHFAIHPRHGKITFYDISLVNMVKTTLLVSKLLITMHFYTALCFSHDKIFFYKPWRSKCFFQFEAIINVLVSSFRFI